LVPVIVTTTLWAPLVGVKLVIDGVPKIMKFELLLMVTPLTVTDTGPDPAPDGTEVVILVKVEPVTTAGVPLNVTTGVPIKLVPLIVTGVPTAAPVGEKLEIVGEGRISKFETLVTVTPLVVTVIGPSIAPEGTVAVILVAEFSVAVAVRPLKNWTVAGARKLVPVMLTVAPTAPLAGVKLLSVGVGRTSKFELLVTVTPLEVTDIGPSIAPAGTVAVILVAELNVALAVTPLKNCTVAGARKLVPVRVIIAPTAPLTGEKLVMVGVASTSKFELLETVMPLVVTEIGPSAAPAGTVAVMLVAELNVALAVIPLKNLTVTGALKFVPVMVIVAPGAPLVGEKLVITGDGNTVKFVAVLSVIPFTVMEIGFEPGAAPAGTVASILV